MNYLKNRYFATGSNTKKVEDIVDRYWLEYNSSINMYRINCKGKIPRELMGYNPHKQVLIDKTNILVSRNAKKH